MFLFLTTTCWGQVSINGTVNFKDDNLSAPGVNVVEKGTSNGTLTGIDGAFELTVSQQNAILIFSFVGCVTQELQLSGEREVFIKLKEDCNKDFFDSRQIHLFANSGVINNPIGGQIDLASPWIFNGVIKGSYSYQTNLDQNEMQIGQVELTHYIGNCDFDMDFRWGHRKVTVDNNLNFRINSIETDLNLRNLKFIAGYSNLDFNEIDSGNKRRLSGLVLGVGRDFNLPLHPNAVLKVGLYKDKIEYNASIQGGYKNLLCFLKFYKLDSFSELSLGFGANLGYQIKKRKG